MEELLVFDGLSEILDEGVLTSRPFLAELFSFAERYGIEGNVYQHYLTYRLLTEENAFSLAAERGLNRGTLYELALKDMEVIADYYDPAYVESICPIGAELSGYEPFAVTGSPLSRRIRSLTALFYDCQTPLQFLEALTADYAARGVGTLSAYDAFSFRVSGSGHVAVTPIPHPDHRGLGRLIGYEPQKQALIQNTAAFLSGAAHNDVLLYGDAGTGKSTAVKALLTSFPNKKLKFIEVNREQYRDLPALIDFLADRAFYFILFIDDLSFEEDETEYKSLKAFLEGGLRRRPEHIAVYATSNRSHLLSERFSDRNDIKYTDDVHRSETVEEKLSLSARFGLRIFFGAPGRDEYQAIVKGLRDRENLTVEDDELIAGLAQFGVEGGRPSGRTAEQYIRTLQSKEAD